MRARAAAIIIQNGHVGLIERHRSQRRSHYFVFPGGGIEPGESAEQAVVREVAEELGLIVQPRQLVAEVWYQGDCGYYFIAEITGGTFGTGYGPEMSGEEPEENGTYTPVWISVDRLMDIPVYPRDVAEIIVNSVVSGWPDHSQIFVDEG